MTASASRQEAEKRGRRAETICIIILTLKGWRILARRMSGRRGTGVGELDIVAQRGNTVAFIEVKARGDMEAAAEAVTIQQRTRIARAADVFLQQRPALTLCNIRFDVMTFGRGPWPRHMVDAWRP